MSDPFVDGCYHLAVAEDMTKQGHWTGAAAHAATASAHFARGRWEAAAAEAERRAHPVRADVVSSEPIHADHHRFVFRCGCLLTVPTKNLDAPNEQTAHVFCPIHEPNTGIPRELIEHWQTQHREEPF